MNQVEREIALQFRIQRGQAIKEMLASPAWTEHVSKYLSTQKKMAITKSYQVIGTEAEVAFCLGGHAALEALEDALQTTAKDVDLTIDDLPEDDSPDITQ